MIRVKHNLHALAEKYDDVAVDAAGSMPGIVHESVMYGRDLAKALAKVESGPHGKNYYKRITGELTSPLEGEFGPSPGGTPVGAGYRHGAGNRDLEKAAGPAERDLAQGVRRMVGRVFR